MESPTVAERYALEAQRVLKELRDDYAGLTPGMPTQTALACAGVYALLSIASAVNSLVPQLDDIARQVANIEVRL